MATVSGAIETLSSIWDPFAALFVAAIGLWLVFMEQRGLTERRRTSEAAIARLGGIFWCAFSVAWTILGLLWKGS